jgi:MFS family permease
VTRPGLRYYGWWGIVLATFVILWATNGLTVGGVAAFDPYLIEALGVTRDALKFGDLIMLGTTAVATLASGWAADRLGVRPVMAVGLVLLAVSFFGITRVESLSDVYVVRFLMGLGLCASGLAICVVIVSRWFVRLRGLALGLMLAGTSFGNAFFPEFFTGLIEAQGLRRAAVYAAVTPLLLLPIVLFAIREWPRDKGLEAYGEEQGATAAGSGAPALSYPEILRRREFWVLGIAAFATFFAILGVSGNLILHARDLGFEPGAAARFFVPLFIMGLVGKILSGFLSDVLGRRRVWILNLALMLGGALLLATLEGSLLFWAVTLFGLGWGGNYSLLQALAGDIFGATSLGRVMGAITVLDAGGGALGPWVTALLFERYGQSYGVAFGVIAALIGLAMVMAFLLRIPQVAVRPAPAA